MALLGKVESSGRFERVWHANSLDRAASPGQLVAEGEGVSTLRLLEEVAALGRTLETTGSLALFAGDLDELLLEFANQVVQRLLQKF